MASTCRPREDGREILDREADLIISAMRLVASGGAHRAIVAGLRLTGEALAIAMRETEIVDVVAESISRSDTVGQDVVISRGMRSPAP
jgi:hypothetical protein